MTDLPEWTSRVEGFDPDRWWCPIVCTGNRDHPFEVLGVIFERANGERPHVAWHIHHAVSLHWVERDDVDVSSLSTTFLCPACDRTPRIPPERWDEIVLEARRVGPVWVDVSLAGG